MKAESVEWLEDLLDRSRWQHIVDRDVLYQECDEKGHHYRVHGKTRPNKMDCTRCKVSWSIGLRMEPAS